MSESKSPRQRISSGLVFKIFEMRRGFIGMQSMSFWSRRNSRTAKAAVQKICKSEIGCDHGGDARRVDG